MLTRLSNIELVTFLVTVTKYHNMIYLKIKALTFLILSIFKLVQKPNTKNINLVA